MQIINRHPLIAISLAVACGLALAHVVNRMFDAFLADSLENFLTQYGWGLIFAAALLAVIVWRRRGIWAWLSRHKAGVAIGVVSVWAVCVVLIVAGSENERKAAATPVTFTGPGIPIGGSPAETQAIDAAIQRAFAGQKHDYPQVGVNSPAETAALQRTIGYPQVGVNSPRKRKQVGKAPVTLDFSRAIPIK